MAVSIKIDGVEINGADGRRLHGQINNANIGGSIREVSISGLLTGSDVDDLQAKWATAQSACNTRKKSVTVAIDGAGSVLEEFFLGDGRTVDIFTYISGDATRIGTATTMPFTLVVNTNETVPAAAGGSAGDLSQEFKGQIGDWRLLKILSDARTEARVLNISFGTLFDEAAYGSFNFATVALEGGKARFQFGTGDLTGIIFKPGMKLFVSASTQYNQTHIITAIDTGNDRVLTDTTWAGTDSGVALIGEATSPQEVYNASRDDLLTMLGVGADGKRSASTGLVLTNEAIKDAGDLIEITMNAEWVEKSYDDSIRSYQLALEVTKMSDWPTDPLAGKVPVAVTAVVTFAVDKEQAGTDDPNTMWKTIRSAVITDIKGSSAASGMVGPLVENVAYDKRSGSVTVTLSFLAENATVFEFSRVTAVHTALDFSQWKDSDGYDILQTGKDPLIVTKTVTVTRTGVGLVDLKVPPPTESGYTYIDIVDDDAYQNPIRREGIGDVWTQKRTKTFKRFKLRGNATRIRVPEVK